MPLATQRLYEGYCAGFSLEGNEKDFAPPAAYLPGEKGRPRQQRLKERLYKLTAAHKLELDADIEKMTKKRSQPHHRQNSGPIWKNPGEREVLTRNSSGRFAHSLRKP